MRALGQALAVGTEILALLTNPAGDLERAAQLTVQREDYLVQARKALRRLPPNAPSDLPSDPPPVQPEWRILTELGHQQSELMEAGAKRRDRLMDDLVRCRTVRAQLHRQLVGAQLAAAPEHVDRRL